MDSIETIIDEVSKLTKNVGKLVGELKSDFIKRREASKIDEYHAMGIYPKAIYRSEQFAHLLGETPKSLRKNWKTLSDSLTPIPGTYGVGKTPKWLGITIIEYLETVNEKLD